MLDDADTFLEYAISANADYAALLYAAINAEGHDEVLPGEPPRHVRARLCA